MIGDNEVSILGLFTTETTARFSVLLMSKSTSSAERVIKMRWVLIFLKALAKVLFTPAVCRSESTPEIKASAMALAVRSAERNAMSCSASRCW